MSVAETARLRLRELTAEDAAFVLELVNEPAWLTFIGDRNVHSLEDARGYIARGPGASYAAHGFGHWAVEPRAGGEPLGMCGLVQRAALPHVDLGFAFLARHWGTGYAREAAAEVVRLARERFRLPALVAITDPDNGPSQRLLEGVGFHYDRIIAWGETNEPLMLYVRLFSQEPAPNAAPRDGPAPRAGGARGD